MNTKEKKFIENIEIIKKMISENRPKSEMSRMLEMKYETMNGYLKKYGFDYKGNPHRAGFVHEESRIPLDKILNNEVTYSTASLKKRLVESGLKKNVCECCGLSEWNGKELPLELHHIDGNHYNNNLENIQILCPNCHSQTEHFRGRIKKKYTKLTNKKHIVKKCEYCGKEFSGEHCGRRKYCSKECYHKAHTKINISKEDLICDFLEIKTYTGIAKKYGVSDKAIKKLAIKLGIIDNVNK